MHYLKIPAQCLYMRIFFWSYLTITPNFDNLAEFEQTLGKALFCPPGGPRVFCI